MGVRRREFLSFATVSFVAAGASGGWVYRALAHDADNRVPFNVRSFGAAADGKAVDTPAVNRAIAAAAAAGGGTVQFPAGTYVCHSIRLKSFVTLYLEAGAIILAAAAGGYDAAEPKVPSIATRISATTTGTTASSGARTSTTSRSSARV